MRSPSPSSLADRRAWTHFWAGRALVLLIAAPITAGFGAVTGLYASFQTLPDVRALSNYVPSETTKIFDAKGRLLANVHGEENRVVVPLSKIPKSLQHALIAIEDSDFYSHFGVNPKGITRAVLVNVAEGAKVEGASTITQQLAKNLFLDMSRTYTRKLAEAWLAIQIEHYYSKPQILELYLNTVFWGHNAYGVEAASLNYFGVPASKLNLAQSAMLAGILRGPEYYTPYRNPKGAKAVQRLVLERMVALGYLSPTQAQAAYDRPLKYSGVKSFHYESPYVVVPVIQALTEKYGRDRVLKGGLRVTTTIDPDLQEQARRYLQDGVKRAGVYRATQGALVAIEPSTGYVKALVGGVDFKASKFNRALQALRPPGSTFKPFVYLTALTHGYSPGTIVVDEPISLPAGGGQWYAPQNYDRRFRGPMTLRRALEQSVNIVAVKLAQDTGLDAVIQTAQDAGIRSTLGHNLSLPLGTSEVTPYELASAYATLANDGQRLPPTLIAKVVDRHGQVLEDAGAAEPERVFKADPVRMLVSMMQGVMTRGTGTAASFGRPAAGKTGTTSDARDVWFAGFTPDLACVVWMGNDNNSRLLTGSTGGEVCAPVWRQFMAHAHRGKPVRGFLAPTKAVEVPIHRRTGRLANPLDPGVETEMFHPGQEPKVLEAAPPAPKPKPRPKPAAKPAASAPKPAAPTPALAPSVEPLFAPDPGQAPEAPPAKTSPAKPASAAEPAPAD